MIKFNFLLLFIFIGLNSLAQDYSIKWGEVESKSGSLIKLIPFLGEDFYSLRWKGGAVFGGYHIAKHENLKTVATERVVRSANESVANFEGVTVLDDHVIVFLSDKKVDKNYLYMQQYGFNMKPRGEAIELSSYILEKGRPRGWFNIIQSKNKEFFAVLWEIPGKKEVNDYYGFKVYDKDLTLVSEGEYTLPFDSNLSDISDHLLTNTGDYFLSVKEFEPDPQRRFFKSYLQYKAMHIYHVSSDGLDDYSLDLSGKRVEAMTMDTDDKRQFTITGVYGDNNVEGVKGLFYLRFDFNKKEVQEVGYEEFGKDFITQDWSDKAKERASRREEKGKGEPTLYNYKMRHAEILPDGSIVGSLEQYYVQISQSFDTRGVARTTYTYYYNDVIAFKVGNNGKGFEWLTKFKKLQVSTNDDGIYSSYAKFVDNGQMCFLFNDNIENYDSKGVFTDARLYSARFSKKRNTVALVTIDTETGEIRRRTFFDRKETGGLAVPKRFEVDYMRREMLLYILMRNKERYGIIHFDQAKGVD